jgi:hypothetical protein
MADIDLTQDEADTLIAMEKHRENDKRLDFPGPGERLAIPLTSPDKRELFMLDVTRAQIKLTKATYQNRARQAVILMRLDIDGPPHRNPDGTEIPCPHLHVYREGYGVKWATPLQGDRYPDTLNLFATFEAFMQHCNVTLPPQFNVGLF